MTGRVDVGEFDEAYERSLRSAAITAITPPVFGLNVHHLGHRGQAGGRDRGSRERRRTASHLQENDLLRCAPMRNDSDTVWMKERQIEANVPGAVR